MRRITILIAMALVLGCGNQRRGGGGSGGGVAQPTESVEVPAWQCWICDGAESCGGERLHCEGKAMVRTTGTFRTLVCEHPDHVETCMGGDTLVDQCWGCSGHTTCATRDGVYTCSCNAPMTTCGSTVKLGDETGGWEVQCETDGRARRCVSPWVDPRAHN